LRIVLLPPEFIPRRNDTKTLMRNLESRHGDRLLAVVTLTFMFAAMISTMPPALPAYAQDRDPIALEAISPDAPIAGEVIVQFRPGTPEATRDRALALVQGSFVRSLDLADLVLAKVPAGTEVTAAESLRIDPSVLAARPNTVTHVEPRASP
jgi:fervidolysin-like protein